MLTGTTVNAEAQKDKEMPEWSRVGFRAANGQRLS